MGRDFEYQRIQLSKQRRTGASLTKRMDESQVTISLGARSRYSPNCPQWPGPDFVSAVEA